MKEMLIELKQMKEIIKQLKYTELDFLSLSSLILQLQLQLQYYENQYKKAET